MSEAMYQQPDEFVTLLEQIEKMDKLLKRLITIHDLEALAEFEKENSIATILGNYETILEEYRKFDKKTLAYLRLFIVAYILFGSAAIYSFLSNDSGLYVIQPFLIAILLSIFYAQKNGDLGGDLRVLTVKIENSHFFEVEGIADFLISSHRIIGAKEWGESKEDIFLLIEHLRKIEFLNKGFIENLNLEIKNRIPGKTRLSSLYLELFLILGEFPEIPKDYYGDKLREAFGHLMDFVVSKLDGDNYRSKVDGNDRDESYVVDEG